MYIPDLTHRHIISVLLANEAGALMRVAGLFSARGYNIESLIVAATDRSSLSRMTIVTEGGDLLVKQIINHLNKLIDVVEVVDLSRHEHIEREMLLLKLLCPKDQQDRLLELMNSHGASLIETTDEVLVIEATAPSYRINELVVAIAAEWTILELARSGVISLGRGHLVLETQREAQKVISNAKGRSD